MQVNVNATGGKDLDVRTAEIKAGKLSHIEHIDTVPHGEHRTFSASTLKVIIISEKED